MIDKARTRIARFSVRLWASLLLTAGSLTWSGCAESIIEYTKLGAWSQSPDQPTVLSGRPSRDSSALGASVDVLSDHDWQTLEKIAPRPIWERLAAARAMFEKKGPQKPSPPTIPDPLGDGMKLAYDVPTTKLPDGKIQMYYRLRHYGGVGVTSAGGTGVDRRKITVAPTDLKALVALVTAQLAGKGTVVALPAENTLVITCDAAVKQSVLTLLAGIDVPPRQVEITAKIFEIKHDFDFQIGAQTLLEHISSDNTQTVLGTFNPVDFLGSIGTAGGFQGGILRLLQVFDDAGISLDTTLQMMADTGLIKMVSSPRMTVTVGKTGYVLAGQELPIQSARLSNDNLVTEKTTYKPIGVQLYITPQVVGDDSVKLHVLTTVTAISGFANMSSMTHKQAGQGLVNPILDSREAETTVTIPNESTLVIGGLRMIRTITRERKMPGLGDIALMEWFFKSHRSQNVINDLYFFVTPRLIKTNKAGRELASASRFVAAGALPARPTPPPAPKPAPRPTAPATAKPTTTAPAKPAPAPAPKPAPTPPPAPKPTTTAPAKPTPAPAPKATTTAPAKPAPAPAPKATTTAPAKPAPAPTTAPKPTPPPAPKATTTAPAKPAAPPAATIKPSSASAPTPAPPLTTVPAAPPRAK